MRFSFHPTISKTSFIASFVTIALLAGAIYGLGYSKLLPVRKIEILGTSQKAYLINLLEGDSSHLILGKPIARVNLRVITKILLHISWIGSATVHRDWLHGQIRIELIERQPIAQFTNASGGITLFDREGAEFTTLATTAKLPTIKFATTDPQARSAVALLLAQLPQDVLQGLTGMRVSSPQFLELSTTIANQDLTIRWGNAEEIPLKVKVLRALLALPENATAKLVDLTSPTAPITK